jgi:hypothetical protein
MRTAQVSGGWPAASSFRPFVRILGAGVIPAQAVLLHTSLGRGKIVLSSIDSLRGLTGSYIITLQRCQKPVNFTFSIIAYGRYVVCLYGIA